MTLTELRFRWQRMIPADIRIDVDPRCLPLLDAFCASMSAIDGYDFRFSGDIVTDEGEIIVEYAPDPQKTTVETRDIVQREMCLLAARAYWLTLPDGSTPRQVLAVIEDRLCQYDPAEDEYFLKVWGEQNVEA